MRPIATILLAAVVAASCAPMRDTAPPSTSTKNSRQNMKLGAFSISLAVKDLAASRTFYEKLGFAAVLGEPAQSWLILRSGDTTVGLFQGMFEGNILTFNPGWSPQCETLAQFDDVRDIQAKLEKQGVKLTTRAEPGSTGPASLTLIDPDGNAILIDQHVPRGR